MIITQNPNKAGEGLNIQHMKYAVEVAKVGSFSKAAELLYIATPNLSRAIKELETDLGITIFERSAKGATLTLAGDEFISYAKGLLLQMEHIENLYKEDLPQKQRFSISVPRACYICEAFSEFSKTLSENPAEIFYKETNSQRAISNIFKHDYKLGIIRYAENYDKYFMAMLEEKGLTYKPITEFSYKLVMSAENPLAQKEEITFGDLRDYIEIAHADPYVPSMPTAKVIKEELPDNIARRIFVFERASQFNLLAKNAQTFMWVSPIPKTLLDRYGLVQRDCLDNKKLYKDILIYRQGYKLTKLDQTFIDALKTSIKQYL